MIAKKPSGTGTRRKSRVFFHGIVLPNNYKVEATRHSVQITRNASAGFKVVIWKTKLVMLHGYKVVRLQRCSVAQL